MYHIANQLSRREHRQVCCKMKTTGRSHEANRPYFVGLLKAALILLAGLGASVSHADSSPNVLLIYVDDLGFGDLGSYGHPVIKTPNIDALARDGMRFTANYSPSALCSPSRAGLLTGRTPYRTGIKSWIPEDSGVYLRDEEVTLAEVLKAAGYATAHIGKWHLNSDLAADDEPQPTEQGFDYYYGHNAFQLPHNHNPTNIYRDKTLLPMQEGYTADLYADEAIAWLEQRDTDKPFFLYLSMAEPHTSFANPPEYNAMYADYSQGEVVPIPNGLAEPPIDQLIPRGPGEYYANVTYMDAQIGRVIDWVDAQGLADDTVIVFSSDNGPVTEAWINWWEVNAYGETGGYRGRKHFLYEGGIRVPAIVRFPGVVEAGSESDVPVIGMDWFVTLATIGGGEVPSDRAIDGVDLSAVLRGGTLPERGLFWALYAANDRVTDIEYVMRRGPWKLMLTVQGEPRELYRLDEDPLEFFDVLSKEPEVAARLLAEAHAMLDSIERDPLRPRLP